MKTIRALIDNNAKLYPDKTFLVAPESGAEMSYAALKQHCLDVAVMLDDLGVENNDKVALLLPNGYWTVALFLGVMYSGRVIVPLNAVAGESALEYVIDHSDTQLILCDAGYKEKFSTLLAGLPASIQTLDVDVDKGVEQLVNKTEQSSSQSLPDTHEDDTGVLIYTSGTTGRPKGVLLSHRNVVAGGQNTAVAHQLTEHDRALCVLPMYHINAEMVTVIAPLVSGGSVVMPHRFSTSSFWNLIADHNCTWFSVVPTIIAYLLEHAEREGFDREALGGLSQLRIGRSASAPLAPEIHKSFEEQFGVPIIETMGLTETAAQILSNPMPPEPAKYGSPGIVFGNEAKIIDEEGNECESGVSGELMIRGSNVMKGYYKNPEATSEALEDDGWLHTGDVAMCDDEGFYFITGRIKELIIKGGENISPREIDEALYEHPSVLEAAGFAIPCNRYGQEVMACVSLKAGTSCTEAELNTLLDSKLGSFKAPKRIFFMDELPKGPSGKIQRLKLPDILQDKMTELYPPV